MSLQDLDEKLHKKELEEETRSHGEDSFNPFQTEHQNPEIFHQEKKWSERNDELKPYRKKIFLYGILAIVVIAVIIAGVVALVKYKQAAFAENKVKISLSGPQDVQSMEPMTYRIKYENNNRIDLNEAEILLNHSENFRPEANQNFTFENATNSRIRIGGIKAYSQGEVELKGKFYAPKDYTVYINATLNYKPANFNSLFKAENKFGVTVRTSPLFLEVTAPLEAASGDKVEYVIDYKNFSGHYFNEIKMKVEYPGSFNFSSSEPAPSEGNNFWYLGSLQADQAGKIRISGVLNGIRNEGKNIKVSLGMAMENQDFFVFNEKEKITKIVGSSLSVTQTVNGQLSPAVNSGERLSYEIAYENKGDIGLRDVIIKAEIESLVLDYSSLNLKSGSFDEPKKTITWKASDVSQLANLGSGEKGIVKFYIPVLDRIPVSSENDKNFTIVSIARIDSPDVPTPSASNKVISSNRIEMKLNSKVVLDMAGNFSDSNISNTGPNPPQVGEETSYALHWRVTNVSNDLENVKIISSIPSGVKWKGKIYPESENISFNERSNQLVWNIGSLKNGIGILDPKRELSFQISIIPQANQAGGFVPLLNSSVLTAKDLFTGKEIRIEINEQDTKIIENGRGKVEEKTAT